MEASSASAAAWRSPHPEGAERRPLSRLSVSEDVALTRATCSAHCSCPRQHEVCDQLVVCSKPSVSSDGMQPLAELSALSLACSAPQPVLTAPVIFVARLFSLRCPASGCAHPACQPPACRRDCHMHLAPSQPCCACCHLRLPAVLCPIDHALQCHKPQNIVRCMCLVSSSLLSSTEEMSALCMLQVHVGIRTWRSTASESRVRLRWPGPSLSMRSACCR